MTLKVGVIGVGGIARSHMPGWAASEHAEVVAGSDISEPGWKDMPLAQGRFTSGTAGQDDYLEGNLHGPKHEEAYGVFDTGAYVGAFGAMRR